MRQFFLLSLFMTAALTGGLQARELLKNGDFAMGEARWDIEGKAEPKSGASPSLVVVLDGKKWTLLEQELELAEDAPNRVLVKIQLQASPDYKPAETSKAYDEVDFGMGGSYGWTARVFPKADLFLTLRNAGGWEYRPIKLTPGSAQTLQAEFNKMKAAKNQNLTLAFPPGTGQVEVKSASATLSN